MPDFQRTPGRLASGGTNRVRGVRALALPIVLLLSACSTPALDEPWWQNASARDDDDRLDRSTFPGASELVFGIDASEPSARFAAGDRALFGLELRDRTERQRWLLLVEMLDPTARTGDEPIRAAVRISVKTAAGANHEVAIKSEVAALRLTRLDAKGEPERSSDLYLLRDALEHGFAHACSVYAARGPGLHGATTDELERFGLTLISLEAVLAIVQSDEQLSAILQRVARTPSLTSILGNLGVAIAIVPDFANARTIGTWPDGGEPLWRIPLTITANDEPAVRVLVDAVDPRSPWNLSAGVVRLSARRPGDEHARLVMELLAARRATTSDPGSP